MNSLWKTACIVLAVVLGVMLAQSAAMSDDDIKKENETYHQQKLATLMGRDECVRYDYSLMILHIATEIMAPGYPAERNVSLNKAIYFPKVDEFTELRSHFTQAYFEHPNTTVRVWLEYPAFHMRSESRVMLYRYNDSHNTRDDRIVGCRAITIAVDQGVVTDMYWDDNCNGCTESMCLEGGCSSTIMDLRPTCSDKDQLKEDPYHCGIKIYVAWTGTDKDNTTLSSYTSVPSRFEKYSFIASAYDAASGFASDFISFWKTPLN